MIQPIPHGTSRPLQSLPPKEAERIAVAVVTLLRQHGVNDARSIQPLLSVVRSLLAATLRLDFDKDAHVRLVRDLDKRLCGELTRFITEVALLKTAVKL